MFVDLTSKTMQIACSICDTSHDATNIRQWKSPVEEIVKICCRTCYDKILLARRPRPNFNPDAPVMVEYQLINSTASTKRKFARTNTEQCESKKQAIPMSLHKDVTLLELSFMKWPTILPTTLQQQNPHLRDDIVWLEETNDLHLYHVKYDGVNFETVNNLSTSSVAEHYSARYDKFDAMSKMLAGKQWGPNHKKYGKAFSNDKEALAQNLLKLLKEWKQNNINAIQLGKFVHFLIECHCNGKLDLLTHPVYARFAHIRQYLKWRYIHFDPLFKEYRTEFPFASDATYRRVGTCDLLAVRKDHPLPNQCGSTLTLSMFDWKNALLNEKGFKTREMTKPEKMKGPCKKLDECNVSHYTIQQNDYEYLATTYYQDWLYNGHVYKKVRFEQKQLIGLHETHEDNTAHVVLLDNIQDIIMILWQERKAAVALWELQGRPEIEKHKPITHTDEESLILLRALIDQHDACNRPHKT